MGEGVFIFAPFSPSFSFYNVKRADLDDERLKRVTWELLVANEIQHEQEYPPHPSRVCNCCDFAPIHTARADGCQPEAKSDLEIWRDLVSSEIVASMTIGYGSALHRSPICSATRGANILPINSLALLGTG